MRDSLGAARKRVVAVERGLEERGEAAVVVLRDLVGYSVLLQQLVELEGAEPDRGRAARPVSFRWLSYRMKPETCCCRGMRMPHLGSFSSPRTSPV